jgi:hypothetical protein
LTFFRNLVLYYETEAFRKIYRPDEVPTLG